MLKQLAIKLYPQLPALRSAIEQGKWREIKPIARVIGWKAAIRLWHARRFERGQTSKDLAKMAIRGYRYPIYFRPGGSDPHVIDQVFHRREYAAVASLPDIKYIIDCGANIGCTTFYLLHHYKQAQAIVIEPDMYNMAVCRRNLRPFKKRVTFLQTGVWPKTCSLVIEKGKYRDGAEWAIQVREALEGEVADVKAVTILEAMQCAKFPRIDLLKVDIEGSEQQVFGQAGTWLELVQNLAIETHGAECELAVTNALFAYEFQRSFSGELSIFTNLQRRLI